MIHNTTLLSKLILFPVLAVSLHAATITTHPASQNATQGAETSLAVIATSAGTTTYQWQKDGVDIPGATGSIFSITSTQPWHIGDYTVKVTDANGTATSNAATLSLVGINSGLWRGLVAYYPMNNNLVDVGLHGLNGTNNGATSQIDRFGKSNRAYQLTDSSHAWIEVTSSTPFQTLQRYTVSAWAKVTADNFVSRILSNEGPDFSGQRGFRLGTTATQYFSGGVPGDLRPKFFWGAGWGGGGDGIDGIGSFAISAWHLVTATYDGATAALYVNGVLDASAAKSGWELSTQQVLQMGRFKGSISQPGYTGIYHGQLDDVRIYNRALTVTDIAALYAAENASNNWRQIYFGSTSITGNAADDADPDRDGLRNLLEFALNLPPNSPNRVPASVERMGGQVEFSYTRGTAAFNGGTRFQVEWSDDLSNWFTTEVVETLLADDGTYQQVKATIPAGSLGRRFARLRVW